LVNSVPAARAYGYEHARDRTGAFCSARRLEVLLKLDVIVTVKIREVDILPPKMIKTPDSRKSK
jgi:hypothetical protein